MHWNFNLITLKKLQDWVEGDVPPVNALVWLGLAPAPLPSSNHKLPQPCHKMFLFFPSPTMTQGRGSP